MTDRANVLPPRTIVNAWRTITRRRRLPADPLVADAALLAGQHLLLKLATIEQAEATRHRLVLDAVDVLMLRQQVRAGVEDKMLTAAVCWARPRSRPERTNTKVWRVHTGRYQERQRRRAPPLA
ncbi:MAG: hypothetical protein ACYST0_08305 [Planctomycetota bacterium]|jgi:hypothetical protein